MAPPVPSPFSDLRVAFVNYWFINRRGAERFLENLSPLFPNLDLYTVIGTPEALGPAFRDKPLHTSSLNRIPGSRKLYRHLLPLYPRALEEFDFSGYDLVISSESGPAKGILTNTDTCHVCYCHTPMRYLWDQYHAYLAELSPLSRMIFRFASHRLRQWDLASASRVDTFLANSENVARRIRKHYRRTARVVYPPVRVASFSWLEHDQDEYYLSVGALQRYKRVDQIIAACSRLGRKLHVVGEGEDYIRLKKGAGPNVTFLGNLPDEELWRQYARCRAFIFPCDDDLGVTTIEASCFGRPSIALGRGGALETVVGEWAGTPVAEGRTGVWYPESTVDSLVEGILWFERYEKCFDPRRIYEFSRAFEMQAFYERMTAAINEALADFRGQRAAAFRTARVATQGA